ncbi:MAG: hypothetical protein ABI672_21735 [Vicinamibacteria bacterium]
MSRPFDLVLASAFVLLAGVLSAAPLRTVPSREDETAQQKAAQKKSEMPPVHAPELRDETFRLMDAYLISNLQESLDLSDEQFARALPLVKRLQADRRDSAIRRMRALRMLRKTLNSGSATESSVADLLKEVKSAATDERAATVHNVEALDAVFTPLQQAKYRVFEAEVDVRLRHLLAKTQEKDRSGNR